MVEGKRRAIRDDVVLGVGADEVVHASLDATYAGAPNLRCPSASNAHEESTMNETQDVDVLNQGLQGEYFGIAAYDAALGTKLLSDKVAVVARGFQADHRAHAQAIREAIERLGGRADASKTWAEYAAQYPPPKLASEADVLRYAASLERSAAIADTKAVAKVQDPALRTLFARIGGVEAMHWAVLRSTLGEAPIPDSFLPVD